MIIKNQWGGSGTGFLVSRLINEKEGRIFLVTNKHVLNEKPELRRSAHSIFLHHNEKNTDGSISKATTPWPIIYGDGSKAWREHPNLDVDVLAFDVTNLVTFKIDRLAHKWVGYDLFCNRPILDQEDITIGEEVAVIGYPLGLSHHRSYYPLIRSGTIATQIGEELEDTVIENGVPRSRILRGFLIDGGIIPGSSGSPVVLKPVIGRVNRKTSSIKMGTPSPFLLGIIAETHYAPIRTGQEDIIPSFAGLGLAFDAETVRETIELFFTA